MDKIPLAQLGLLVISSLFFLLAFFAGVQALRPTLAAPLGTQETSFRRATVRSSLAMGLGITLALSLLLWRAFSSGLVADEFAAFLMLALLLAGVGIYFRLTRHLRSLAVFIEPLIAGLLLLGGLVSLVRPPHFSLGNIWILVHLITVLLGSACFAAGCVGGFVYLLADRQLRRNGQGASRRWSGLPALASVERFNQRATLLGFPLLTVAAITGFLVALQHRRGPAGQPLASPKALLTIAAWLVYAVLLHVRFAPSFRGRRAAWLTIIGFALVVAVFLAVYWIPSV